MYISLAWLSLHVVWRVEKLLKRMRYTLYNFGRIKLSLINRAILDVLKNSGKQPMVFLPRTLTLNDVSDRGHAGLIQS